MTARMSPTDIPDAQRRLALFAVLLLAAALRLHHIDFHGIWPDELASLHYATAPVEQILFGPDFDYHPPLYYLFLHFWLDVFPAGELSIRLPSAVFGVLSVFMAYLLGARVYGPFAGLVAATILALSPWHLVYAHLARMYTPLLFFSLCSTYFLYRILETPRRLDVVLYVLTTILALYTQNMAVFMVVGQNIYYLCRWLSARRNGGAPVSFVNWCLIQIGIVTIYLPWIWVTVFTKLTQIQGNYWVRREPIYQYLGGVVFIFAGDKKHAAVFLFAPWLCLLALLGTVQARRLFRPARAGTDATPFFRSPRRAGLFWALLFVPPALTAIASQVMQPFFVPRSLIASSVALYVLAAVGIAGFAGRRRTVLLAVTLAAAAVVLLQSYLQKSEHGFRRPVLAALADAAPGDAVVIDKHAGAYYARQLTARRDLRIADLQKIVAGEPAFVTGFCAGRPDRRFWLVRSKPVPEAAAGLFDTGGLALDTTRTFANVTVDTLHCRAAR